MATTTTIATSERNKKAYETTINPVHFLIVFVGPIFYSSKLLKVKEGLPEA